MAAVRTAREVVELYNLVVWNEHNLELAEELLADNVVRHEVGQSHTLTRDQAVQRVADMWQVCDALQFDLKIVVAGGDGEYVTIVYDSTVSANGTETSIASIELFRVVDGRITEVWNCGYKQGVWN
jgi:predicted SnoaL-like aldol condensation-catalyzing enzyme